MIFDSLDIYAIESQIEIADYVRESAQFEIESSNNNAFVSIYEAATNISEKENTNWVSSVISKIKMFAKSAIAKLKMILNQLFLGRKRKTVERIQKKLARRSHDTSMVYVKINSAIAADLNTLVKYNLIKADDFGYFEKVVSEEMSRAPAYIERCVRNNEVPKNFNTFYKSFVDTTETPKYADKAFFKTGSELSENDTIDFINTTEEILKELYMSTAKISKTNEKLKSEGHTSSKIRYATSVIYNHLTTIASNYYKSAISVAKFFLKESKNNISSEIKYDDPMEDKEFEDDN